MRFTPDPIIIRGESEFHWRPIQIRFALKFPTRLWIVILMSAICLLTLTISITLSKSEEAPSNIFAEYADFFPEQYWNAGLESTFRCGVDVPTGVKYCFLSPQDSRFSDAVVTIENTQITRIVLTAKKDVIKAGDLVALWGRPDIELVGHIAYLDWRNQKITAVAYDNDRRFDYFLPVSSVVFY